MKEPLPEQDGYADDLAPASSFQPRRFLVALRRKWWILLITLALAAGGAFYYLRTEPVLYVSKARLWIPGKMRVSEIAQYTEDVQNYFGTQIELLRSDKLLERALDRLKRADPDFAPPRDDLGRDLPHDVRITQLPKTGILVLECSSPAQTYPQVLLSALIEEFLTYKKEVRGTIAREVLTSVSEQVYKQEHALRAEQEKLNQFRREHNLALLEEQVRSGGNRLARLDDQVSMLELEMTLLDAATLEKNAGLLTLTNAETAFPDPRRLLPGPVPAAPISEEHAAAQQRVQQLRSRREQIGRIFTGDHPKVVAVNAEIAAAQQVLDEFQKKAEELQQKLLADQAAKAREALRIRIDSLKATIKELEASVGDANRLYAEYDRLRAEIQRQQGIYDRMQTLLQGVDLNSNIDQEGFAILQPAGTPRLANPGIARVAGGAAAAGLLLGLGIVFLFAWFDDRCDSLDDVRNQFAEVVMSQVPDLKYNRSNGAPPLLTETSKEHIFAESCRHLRSSLLFGSPNGETPRTIMVTSATPDEGKSTIAANLALALALGGARVLLIDADLRCGRLHRLIKAPASPGLAELIQQSGELASFTLPTSFPTLFLLPRGKPNGHSGELFLSPQFGVLLDKARANFDYVIIDSIPIFAADDATTLAPKTDGVLFVLRRGHTSSRLAREALDVLYQRQVTVLGLVFNRANSASASYRYYKYSKYAHEPEVHA